MAGSSQMVKKCPECGSINLFWNREKGEIICRDCGLVVEDKMVDFGHFGRFWPFWSILAILAIFDLFGPFGTF